MTLSRLAPPLLLILISEGAFAAPPVTAEQAMGNYRQLIKPVRELDCPRSAGSDEIVVCGRSADQLQPGRLPLPVEPQSGDRTRLAPGEIQRGDAGYGDARYCFTRCDGFVGVDIQTAKKVASAIKQVLEGDEE